MIDDHREDALGTEEFADEAACFVGVVFGEVRVAAEFLEDVAEGGVADGIGDEVYVFAVAAKAAVHEFECALMDADGGDGGICACALRDGVADDVLVFENDLFFDALEARKSAVGF